MNKNSILKYVGHDYVAGRRQAFTHNKKYKIVAGRGDGVPRNSGTLGAFIQSTTSCVVVDDNKNFHQIEVNHNWELVQDSDDVSWYKGEGKSPIPESRAVC